ncbi:VTT domain-containing protein [Azospirillum sp. SYSU D00513]|uniref:TVP38/TMEM64 family protein n=1 Tax=Azospirillum sp. SYSU D00513 TaxID=2812561 RepID=UPI001A9742EA|nr:VTT domain-containing protein [Azospirillum sp. SYSU D00513]
MAEPAPPARSWSLGRLLPAGLLVAGLAAAFGFGLHEQLSLTSLARHHAELEGFVRERGALAALAYVGLYALAVALSIPCGMALTLAGGLLFGTAAGTAFAVMGATLGATLLFLVARTALGGTLRARAGPWAARLEAGFRENAFIYLLVLRLTPLLPFWLVNLVPAVLGMPVGAFALATLVGIVPATLVYASVGNGLGAVLEAGTAPNLRGLLLRAEILLPLLGLALLALLPVAVRWWRRRRGGP